MIVPYPYSTVQLVTAVGAVEDEQCCEEEDGTEDNHPLTLMPLLLPWKQSNKHRDVQWCVTLELCCVASHRKKNMG